MDRVAAGHGATFRFLWPIAPITDLCVVRKILEHLKVRSTPLPRAPARDPAWEQQTFDDKAA